MILGYGTDLAKEILKVFAVTAATAVASKGAEYIYEKNFKPDLEAAKAVAAKPTRKRAAK